MRRRRDAEGYVIEDQGSPALLDNADDVEPIAEFVRDLDKWRGAFVSPPERLAANRAVDRVAGIKALAWSTQRSRDDAAPEREPVLDPDDRTAVPGGDLVVVEDAERIEAALDARADAVDRLEIVPALRTRRRQARAAGRRPAGRVQAEAVSIASARRQGRQCRIGRRRRRRLDLARPRPRRAAAAAR